VLGREGGKGYLRHRSKVAVVTIVDPENPWACCLSYPPPNHPSPRPAVASHPQENRQLL